MLCSPQAQLWRVCTWTLMCIHHTHAHGREKDTHTHIEETGTERQSDRSREKQKLTQKFTPNYPKLEITRVLQLVNAETHRSMPIVRILRGMKKKGCILNYTNESLKDYTGWKKKAKFRFHYLKIWKKTKTNRDRCLWESGRGWSGKPQGLMREPTSQGEKTSVSWLRF